jgi:hypothetical protein
MTATEAAADAKARPPARAHGRKRPRSAITSGRQAFITGNPNSAWARRFADLILGHVSDLGGRSNLSEAQFALCKRAAGLECELEQMEGRMSLGEEVDLDRYGRGSSHLRRMLESLGLERRTRDAAVEGDVEVFSPMRARWAAEAGAVKGVAK